MSDIEQRMAVWYDGKSHACVGYSDGSGSACGKIMPPNSSTLLHLESYKMELRACVRTESMEIKCAPVTKLYTSNIIVDNWGWMALALASGYLFYKNSNKPSAA